MIATRLYRLAVLGLLVHCAARLNEALDLIARINTECKLKVHDDYSKWITNPVPIRESDWTKHAPLRKQGGPHGQVKDKHDHLPGQPCTSFCPGRWS